MLRVVLVATRDGDVTWERSAPSSPSLGLVHQVPLSSKPVGRLVLSDQWSVAVTSWSHIVVLSTSTVQPWSLTSKSKTVPTASQIKVLVGEVLGAVLGLPLGAEDGSALGEVLGEVLGLLLGLVLGASLGLVLGLSLGLGVGTSLGLELGPLLGAVLGDVLGLLLGEVLGVSAPQI
jgi:uncharacterized membrane protein